MADAIVSVVAETVTRLLAEEATLLSGVSTEVGYLCTELHRMQALLRDADSVQHSNESVRNLLSETRRLSLVTEDLVERYVIDAEVKKSSPRRGFKKCFSICGKVGTLHEFATEIADVKTRISSMRTTLQQQFGTNITNKGDGESSNSNQYELARQTYPHQADAYFVGMEDAIKTLVSLLNPNDYKQHVISIWGMGGLGKTTVARKVYNHYNHLHKDSFSHFAWTCVTQKAQAKQILRDVLTQLAPEMEKATIKIMTERELVKKLHETQTNTSCLIVLDDMWQVVQWEAICAAFGSHVGKTKVLLTTRKGDVAKIGFPYKLNFLSQAEGCELLRQILSTGKTDFEIAQIAPYFEKVGIKIVSKCGGLPLAICLLGGILKDKNSLESWKMVNNHISSYLNIGEENEGSSARLLDKVLSLSYNDLPYHLKLCFLYLGNFKEDEKIKTALLFDSWIIEGLVMSIHRRNRETFTEVAERYLEELGHRCMVLLKVNDDPLPPMFVWCSLHDVMKDFCLEKCKEQEFLKVVDNVSYLTIDYGAHRLVLHIENEVNAAMLDNIDEQDGEHTRSLYCVSMGGEMDWPADKVLQKFKRLRVLRFEGFKFGRSFPLELKNLIHLRSLHILEGSLDELTPSIAGLPFLHTLVLDFRSKVKIPNVLSKMKWLRNLQLGSLRKTWTSWSGRPFSGGHGTDDGKKLRLNGLTKLDTIIGLDSEVDEIKDLKELKNIRYLGFKVTGLDEFKVLMDYINGNGRDLQEMDLKIYDCDFNASEYYDHLSNFFKSISLRALTLNSKFNRFPCYGQEFLQGLAFLDLIHNDMTEDPMPILGQLPVLHTFWLQFNYYIQHLTCRGFLKLNELWIRTLPNLSHWEVEEGSMPKLSELYIWECPSLPEILGGLEFLKDLNLLRVQLMSTEFCDRLKEGGADHHKIQHVRWVDVFNFRKSGV